MLDARDVGIRTTTASTIPEDSSKPLRQSYIKLVLRGDTVQAEIASEVELQVRCERAAQSPGQRVDRLLPRLKRLAGEDLGIERPTLVERMTDIDQEVEGAVVAAVGSIFQIVAFRH